MTTATALRTTVKFPAAASVRAYQFHGLVKETLTQGALYSDLGWYPDSQTRGPVWHRWRADERSRFGISLIVGIYALWSQGLLEITVGEGHGLVRPGSARPSADLAPLEQEVLAIVAQHAPLRSAVIVEKLAVVRGRHFKADERWFAAAKRIHDAPACLVEALELCKALVQLEAGTDLDDDLLRDQRGDSMQALEDEVFEALQCG